MTPKDVHVLIPEPANVTLYSERDFAVVIECRILGWVDSLGGHDDVTGPYEREAGGLGGAV